MAQPSISAVMVTYGRYTVVQRAVAMFLSQTCQDAELIILHTDPDQPLCLAPPEERVRIINNPLDYLTGQPYTNTGAIRRDALTHATGRFYVCYDDDDIYLPWYLQQALDGITNSDKVAWKPQKSLYRHAGGIELVQNTMEASVISDLETVRRIGFNLHSGKEGLSWYIALRDRKELNENNLDYAPSYCFNWADGVIAPHKQSAFIDHPDNFSNHILKNRDRPNGRSLQPRDLNLEDTYYPYYNFLRSIKDQINPAYWNKYVEPFIK